MAKMDLGPSTQPAPNLIGKAGALSTYPQQSTDVRLRGVTRFRGYGCPEATVCPSSAGTGAPIPSFEQGQLPRGARRPILIRATQSLTWLIARLFFRLKLPRGQICR